MAVDALPAFRAQRLAPEALEALAAARLTRVLRAAARTRFYGERLRAAGIERADPLLERDPARVLAALAPSDKAELRRAGPQLLAGGRERPEWRSSTSSGSTGEPFRVFYEPRAWATLKYLIKLRARHACGTRLTDRVAVLDAIPLRQPARAPMEYTGQFLRVSALQPAPVVADLLAAFRPDTLYGLPSALAEVAAELGARGRRLPVQRVFTGGELLPRSVRDALGSAFQAGVYDVYGTSETKEIAWECPEGGMHVNADVVRVEALDDEGRPVPDGVEGELVATVLVNRAMPLLRYRIGDRGSLRPQRCSCGRSLPLLGVVTGREADVLVLAGGRRVSPYVLTCALERVADVLRYQVTQLDPSRLRVRAILEPGADQGSVAARVRAALRVEVAPFLEAEVEFVERLPAGPRAKFRVVQPMAHGRARD